MASADSSRRAMRRNTVCKTSSESAVLPVIRYAVRNTMAWCSRYIRSSRWSGALGIIETGSSCFVVANVPNRIRASYPLRQKPGPFITAQVPQYLGVLGRELLDLGVRRLYFLPEWV